jgi:two-component system, OmpR family, phosphate regulon sensor histidine kinase PhoR
MTIKLKLILIGIFFLIFIVLGSGFIFYYSEQSQRAEYRESVAQELIFAVFERNLFLSDYLLHPTDRARVQFLARNNDIGVLLLSSFDAFQGNSEDKEKLRQIEDNYNRITLEIKNLFAERDATTTTTTTTMSATEDRRVAQILIKSQLTVDLSNQIIAQASTRIKRIRQQAVTTVVLLVIVGALFSITITVIMRNIIRSLKQLEAGTRSIAGGKLDIKLDVNGRDELGVLAMAFNTMADKLKESYAGLEAKVKERTQSLRDQIRETTRFKQAVDTATDAVVMTTPDQRIVYCNDVCEKLSGYSRDEALGKDINKLLVSPKTPKETLAKMQDAVSSGKQFITEGIIIKNKTGQEIQVQLSIYPIKDDGQIQFFVGLLQDISKRKLIDKAKTEFVSLASHQLRTPLSTINWYSEMLLDGDVGEVTPEQRDYLKEIYESNKRMVALVSALLNVSRIDMGTFAIDPEPTDIVDLAKNAVKDFAKLIKDKKISFKNAYGKIPKVNVDPKLVRIVFQNLISNAIKYTSVGGTVSLAIEGGEEVIKATVTDTGIGIPENQQEKIFQKLFRADNVVGTETDGTGLGLYIVKAVVEASGGKIWFESKENEGTKFFFTIPLTGMKRQKGVKGLADHAGL